MRTFHKVIETETRRNPPSKPIETHRNQSKPIETCQNRKVSTFAKMGLGFCPATLVIEHFNI